MDGKKDAGVDEAETDRSSPLLFEDSQGANGDHSMEVNDSKETNFPDNFPEMTPSRPQLNIFSSQQLFMSDTPIATQGSPLRGAANQNPSKLSLSLSKRIQTNVKQRTNLREESPSASTVSIDEEVPSISSVSSVTDQGTPKTEHGKLLSSKRKASEEQSSDDSDVEVLGDNIKETVLEKTPEERKRKRPRPSVECVYQSTPHRASSSPFRAVDISDEGLMLKSIPEENDTADISLHFSPSQDTAVDKNDINLANELLQKNNDIEKGKEDAAPQSSSSDENSIFAQVDQLVHKSSPDEITNDKSVIVTEETEIADTLRLEDSDPNLSPSQKSGDDNKDAPIEDKEKKDKWEEGFILTKIKYRKMENDTLENVKLEWHIGITTEFTHESSSSLRSSMSPGSVNSDTKLPFILPGPRQSVASSSSSSSSGSLFRHPNPKEVHAQTGPSKFLNRSLVHQKDLKIDPKEVFAKILAKESIEQSCQTIKSGEGNGEEDTTLAADDAVKDEETPINNKVKGRKGSTSRTSQRGRKKTSVVKAEAGTSTGKSKQDVKPRPVGRKKKLTGSASAQASPEPLPATPSSSLESKSTSSVTSSVVDKQLSKTSTEHKKQEDLEQSSQPTGVAVFAKWTDDKFYPGKIGKYRNGRWEIHFDDGQQRLVLPENVITVDKLPDGQPILAAESGEYYPGIILNLKENTQGEVQYIVDLHQKGEFVVNKVDLCLSEDQIKYLRENSSELNLTMASPAHRPDVSLDNLMDGKRSRSRRQMSVPDSPSRAKRSAVLPNSPLSSRRQLSLTDSPSRGAGQSKKLQEEPGCSVMSSDSAAESSHWNADWEFISGLEDAAIPEPAFSDKKDKIKDKEKELGPFPKKKIFKDYIFCIVYSSGQDSDSQNEMDSELESPDQETDKESFTLPFDKRYMELQLRKGGGTVVEFFEPYQVSQTRDKCLLISNKCNATAKSVMCLALGILSVRHTWVTYCCKEDKLVPPKNYYLPAGHSQQLHKMVEWSERPKNAKPFSSHSIALVSNTGQLFLDFWKKVLVKAKTREIFSFTCDDFLVYDKDLIKNKVGVVITDSEFTEELLDFTKRLDVPLLRTSWVIQCLVHGKSVTYEPHLLQSYQNQTLATIVQSLTY